MMIQYENKFITQKPIKFIFASISSIKNERKQQTAVIAGYYMAL